MNKNSMLSAISIVTLVGSVVILPTPIYAAEGIFGGNTYISRFVDFIAQKFNLDKNQVQNAMTDFRTQEKATITPRPTMNPEAIKDMEKKRLDELVKQGKITNDQENAILQELDTLRTKYPMDNTGTPQERKTRRDAMQNELTEWAKAQNVDIQYIRPMGRGGRGHFGPTFSNTSKN